VTTGITVLVFDPFRQGNQKQAKAFGGYDFLCTIERRRSLE
jgi:hypothetical protein